MMRLLICLILLLSLSATAYGQSAAKQRKKALEAVSISEIPLAGYLEPREDDEAVPLKPAYTYNAYVTHIRDADSVLGVVDLGFNISINFSFRFYANDAFEITRKGGRSKSHVARGYKCRDLMVQLLGSLQTFPKKATFHEFAFPIPVIVKSKKADKYAERWLFQIYKDGKDLNQISARAGCAIVTKFEANPAVYDRYTSITDSF